MNNKTYNILVGLIVFLLLFQLASWVIMLIYGSIAPYHEWQTMSYREAQLWAIPTTILLVIIKE